MQTSLFDYRLPTDRIAQTPLEPRDQAKLLIVQRTSSSAPLQRHAWAELTMDRHIYDLPGLLRAGDLLVFNNSRVFKARLAMSDSARSYEIFLLRPTDLNPHTTTWVTLGKPGKNLRPGHRLRLAHASPSVPLLRKERDEQAVVLKKNPDGTLIIDMRQEVAEVMALTDRIGSVPLPPYVKTPIDAERYQTIYADKTGSVAAPTAGFHFTPELFNRLDEKGIQCAFVTLHVGLGTFRPMKSATLEEHAMHEEWVEVPEHVLKKIAQTKKDGGRVIAVGTTTVRALESAACPSFQSMGQGLSDGFKGFTDLFITPGYKFKAIDGLLTNFHLPKSTLLVLVCAFAGRDNIMRAYQHAIDHGYRFYSFGDAMLIL